MNVKRHTPGPWRWIDDELIGGAAKDARDPDTTTASKSPWPPIGRCIIKTDGGYYPPRKFDRYLIAAASDLLAACESAAALLANPGIPTDRVAINDAIGACRAAIAKATGQDK